VEVLATYHLIHAGAGVTDWRRMTLTKRGGFDQNTTKKSEGCFVHFLGRKETTGGEAIKIESMLVKGNW